MNKYEKRWTCEKCGRKVSLKLSPNKGVCDRCEGKPNPNLHSLNKIPQQYFEFERIKVEGIKLEGQ
jgi:hypothetical protein